MTWFTRIPYNRYLDAALRFVSDVTDPYLNFFRRFIPSVRLGPGSLDLSPIVGVLVLSIVGGIVVRAIGGWCRAGGPRGGRRSPPPPCAGPATPRSSPRSPPPRAAATAKSSSASPPPTPP